MCLPLLFICSHSMMLRLFPISHHHEYCCNGHYGLGNIFGFILGVELLFCKVYLYLIFTKYARLFPQIAVVAHSPISMDKGPEIPIALPTLGMIQLLACLAERSGYCYQHLCWKRYSAIAVNGPILPWLSSVVIFTSPALHSLLTTSTTCLHCWALCFSNLKVHSNWTS